METASPTKYKRDLFFAEKVEKAIERIRKFADMAKKRGEIVRVAFSGGKDSVVVLDLAKRAGIEFDAYMGITTIDPPEVMRFVRTKHPEVRLEMNGKDTFLNLLKKGKILPSPRIRWCCEQFKETQKYKWVISGVRASESARRAKQNPTEIKGLKKRGGAVIHISFEDAEREIEIGCDFGKGDRLMLSPIFDWSTDNVWQYIIENKLDYCELYDRGDRRVGCMFCPMASDKKRKRDAERYPKFAELIRRIVYDNAKGIDEETREKREAFVDKYVGR